MNEKVRDWNKSVFDNEKEVTVSIVTYNNAEEIAVLMKSLEECSYFGHMTVYVIDNASTDDTVKIIKEDYPWVRVIVNRKNLGFGGGHNLAIKNVKSKYHIIVNPDIVVPVESIENAVAFMDTHTDVAAMTPYVLNTDGTQQFLPKKNPCMKYMIGGFFENYSNYCRKLREEYTLKNEIVTKPIEVEFCSGCFMFARTSALQRVGGFDERYFLYFEDADLTRKLRREGRAVYNPNIKVIHKWHRDNKRMSKNFWMSLKSMMIYMKKWSREGKRESKL